MKRIVWLKWVSFVFLAIAVGLAGWIFWISRAGDAISFPVPPRSGFSITRQFRVPAKREYRIELRFSRSMEFERLRKLLQAGNVVKIALLQNGDAVKMRYFKEPRFRPGIVSTEEDGNLGFAEDWISQDIADFTGYPGKLYSITCLVVRPIEELSVTNPTLVVALEPLEVEGGAVLSALLLGGALLSAVLAIILGIVYYFLRRRSATRVLFSKA